MLIVQGLKRWTEAQFNLAAYAITVAPEGIQHQQKWFTRNKHTSKAFRWVRWQIQKSF